MHEIQMSNMDNIVPHISVFTTKKPNLHFTRQNRLPRPRQPLRMILLHDAQLLFSLYLRYLAFFSQRCIISRKHQLTLSNRLRFVSAYAISILLALPTILPTRSEAFLIRFNISLSIFTSIAFWSCQLIGKNMVSRPQLTRKLCWGLIFGFSQRSVLEAIEWSISLGVIPDKWNLVAEIFSYSLTSFSRLVIGA